MGKFQRKSAERREDRVGDESGESGELLDREVEDERMGGGDSH